MPQVVVLSSWFLATIHTCDSTGVSDSLLGCFGLYASTPHGQKSSAAGTSTAASIVFCQIVHLGWTMFIPTLRTCVQMPDSSPRSDIRQIPVFRTSKARVLYYRVRSIECWPLAASLRCALRRSWLLLRRNLTLHSRLQSFFVWPGF